jgi:hypothetical protein
VGGVLAFDSYLVASKDLLKLIIKFGDIFNINKEIKLIRNSKLFELYKLNILGF